MSGETLVASVFDGDAKAAGIGREELAQQWAAAMQRAVDDYRVEHGWRVKLTRLSLGILTIILGVGLVVVIRAVTRQLMLKATAHFESTPPKPTVELRFSWAMNRCTVSCSAASKLSASLLS
jgi:hypothetical protein